MKMKLFLLALLIAGVASAVVVAKQVSEKATDAKLDHVVALLDGYRGQTSDLDVAQAELDEILEVEPRSAPAYREKARYFIMRGHTSSLRFQPGSLEAADASLTQAIKIKPDYAEAYVLRGHLYRMMGRHQEALAALRKAEALGTADPWLHNNWADLLIDERKYEEAARRYRRVVDGQTRNKKAMGSAIEGLVRYYIGVGQLDQADAMHRKAIDFEPTSAWAHGNYAQFLLCERDDYESSIAQSRQALRLMDYGAGRYLLAAALYRKWAQGVLEGKGGPATVHFLEAQQLYPDVADIAGRGQSCPPLEKVKMALSRGTPPQRSDPAR